jgi:hypothetical protein
MIEVEDIQRVQERKIKCANPRCPQRIAENLAYRARDGLGYCTPRCARRRDRDLVDEEWG